MKKDENSDLEPRALVSCCHSSLVRRDDSIIQVPVPKIVMFK